MESILNALLAVAIIAGIAFTVYHFAIKPNRPSSGSGGGGGRRDPNQKRK